MNEIPNKTFILDPHRPLICSANPRLLLTLQPWIYYYFGSKELGELGTIDVQVQSIFKLYAEYISEFISTPLCAAKELGELNPSLYKSRVHFSCMQCASEYLFLLLGVQLRSWVN